MPPAAGSLGGRQQGGDQKASVPTARFYSDMSCTDCQLLSIAQLSRMDCSGAFTLLSRLVSPQEMCLIKT